MSITHDYPVSLNWLTGRKGNLSSSELETTIEVATPPEFPGGIPGVWSPEHLFVAAVSSCLMTTFLAIAENSGLKYQRFFCEASGKLEKEEKGFRITEVTLRPLVILPDASQEEKAKRVLEKAEANCLISNSINSKIIFEPEIKVGGELKVA